MGTIVTIRVGEPDVDGPRGGDRRARAVDNALHDALDDALHDAIDRAFGWFREVEARCSRFDEHSELMQLVARPGVPVRVSKTLFHTVRLALAVAEETGGAFDPTVGHAMASRGFSRHYHSGQTVRTPIAPDGAVSYRDVSVDAAEETIALRRPLVLDLGAVAKGLAIDLAANELRAFKNFAIDAGGDLYLAGRGPGGGPWSVGIRHPREDRQLVDTLHVSDLAVCTSGDYERRGAGVDGGHHILDPRTGASAAAAASVTVVAPTAVLADALATAAFVLGVADGLALLERQGVDGLIVTPSLECYATQGFLGFGSTIRPHAQRPADHHPRAGGRAGRVRRALRATGARSSGRRRRRGAP
jgi:thiamine biosynthesis lipoprotein